MKCAAHGCDKLRKHGKLCDGHRTRRDRGKPIGGPLRGYADKPAPVACSIEGCENEVRLGSELCRGHEKRKERGQAVNVTLLKRNQDPREAHFSASLALVGPGSDSEEGWRKIREAWRQSFRRYAEMWADGLLKGQKRRGPE